MRCIIRKEFIKLSREGGRLLSAARLITNMPKTKKSAHGGKMPIKFSSEPKGLVICYIRAGKGKTTAAMGMAVRAAGDGKNVFILQFVKAANKSAEKITEGEWPVSSEINF